MTITFPTALPTEDGQSIRAFVYELVGYVRRHVFPGQEAHATARVLVRREDQRQWWRFYNDWRKVSDVATPLTSVRDNVRMGFYIRSETVFDAPV